MIATFRKSTAKGTLSAPPSKSDAHRLLIAAALADGESVVRGLPSSRDILATIGALRSLGAGIDFKDGTATVRGVRPGNFAHTEPLFCDESGSTLRFLIPLCLLSDKPHTLIGSEKLFSRPLGIYEDIAAERSLSFVREAGKVTLCGPLTAGDYFIPGNISSQFVTGLLYALPLLPGDSRIHLIPPVESRPYISMTLRTLRAAGITVREIGNDLLIPGGQNYRPFDVTVEGDYSNAAFLSAFTEVGGDVRVTGLASDSLQGDRAYINDYVSLNVGFAHIDLSDTPDLGPILFTLAAMKNGARFTGTERLRVKESDRVDAMVAELSKCGATIDVGFDTVTVHPGGIHAPTEPLAGHNDHRVVMSLSVLLSTVGGEILGAEAVAKSFPDFFDKIKVLGIEVEENGMDL